MKKIRKMSKFGHRFTFLELVVVMILSSLILLYCNLFALPLVESYLSISSSTDLLQHSSLLVNRLSKELKSVETKAQVIDNKTIHFSGSTANSSTLTWNDQTLVVELDQEPIAENVSSFIASESSLGAITVVFAFAQAPEKTQTLTVFPRF